MSRGPGVLQRRVLETLATYAELGRPQQVQRADDPWCAPKSTRLIWDPAAWWLSNEGKVADYIAGRRVPVRVLTRDLGCGRGDLSRALKALEIRGLVVRYTSSMDALQPKPGLIGSDPWCIQAWEGCKYVGLSTEGEAWISANNANA